MGFRKWLVAAIVLVAATVFPSGIRAEEASLQWSVTPVYGETYRPGQWVPLRVAVSNAGTDRRLEIRVNNFSTTLDIPGGGSKATIMYIQVDQARRVPVVLYDGEAKIAGATIDLKPTSDPIVATLLEQTLPKLQSHSLVGMTPAELPGSLTGLEMLDALVFDEHAWGELSPEQQAAVRAWIADGGILITGAASGDSLPPDLRAATSAGNATFDGAALARQLGYEQPAGELPGTRLRAESAARPLLVNDGNPLVVSRSIGAGRVLAVAVALNEPELLGWRGLDRLWAALVPQVAVAPWAGPFANSASLRDSSAPNYLNNLPALDLPPLRALLILLGIYVLLAGPVNYLILRRLDRQAWAWATIPALTLVFALLAYGFGARQRGTDIIINELAIIENNGDGRAAVRGYAGVFSPIKSIYVVRGEPSTLLRPLQGGSIDSASGSLKARYSNDPAEVTNLAINQWSMEMFAFERQIDDAPQAELTLRLEGDTIRGTVRNRSALDLEEAAIIVGGQAYKFGTLNPGEERPIEMRLKTSFDQSAISYLLYQKELDAAYQTPRGPDRDLMAKTQAIDTAVPTGYGPASPDPIFLAFVKREIATLTLPDQRYSRTQRTLLYQHASIEFSKDELSLDSRWTSVKGVAPVTADSEYCFTSRGNGVAITAAQGEIAIGLPQEVSAIDPTELQFVPAFDGVTDPSKLGYELYNWQSSAWENVTYRAGFIRPTNPAAYVSNGQVRMRYSVPENLGAGGGWWGCFAPGMVLKGVLQ